MGGSQSHAIWSRMHIAGGIGRRTLAKVLSGGAIAGLAALPGFGVMARQDEADATAHPVIVALTAVLIDAAAELDAPADEIAVQRLEARDWPDSCLGLAGEGEACAEVITPGYHIVLGPPADGFSYRASQEGVIRPEPAGDTALQVIYELTGGIAGEHKILDVDSADLPAADATELRRLVEAADFWNLPAEIDNGLPVDDGYEFPVTVGDGSRSHTVTSYSGDDSGQARYPGFWDLLGWLNPRVPR